MSIWEDKQVKELYKTIDTNEFIVLANYKTYPKDMKNWLDTYKIKKFVSDFNDESIRNFIDILCNYNMVFFQSTKLLLHEINDIEKYGLRNASCELFNYKITEAYNHGYLSKDDFNGLISVKLYEKENRQNRIFCFANADNIVQDSCNYYAYNYWGGEITTQDKNYIKYPVLQKIGIPCLVSFKFSLSKLKEYSKYRFEEIVKKIIYEYNNKDCAARLCDVDVFIPNVPVIPILKIYKLILTED